MTERFHEEQNSTKLSTLFKVMWRSSNIVRKGELSYVLQRKIWDAQIWLKRNTYFGKNNISSIGISYVGSLEVYHAVFFYLMTKPFWILRATPTKLSASTSSTALLRAHFSNTRNNCYPLIILHYSAYKCPCH